MASALQTDAFVFYYINSGNLLKEKCIMVFFNTEISLFSVNICTYMNNTERPRIYLSRVNISFEASTKNNFLKIIYVRSYCNFFWQFGFASFSRNKNDTIKQKVFLLIVDYFQTSISIQNFKWSLMPKLALTDKKIGSRFRSSDRLGKRTSDQKWCNLTPFSVFFIKTEDFSENFATPLTY